MMQPYEGGRRNASTETDGGEADGRPSLSRFMDGDDEATPHVETDARTDATEGTYFTGPHDNWTMPTFLSEEADVQPAAALPKDKDQDTPTDAHESREKEPPRGHPTQPAIRRTQGGAVRAPQFWYETDICYICKNRVYYFSQSTCCAVPAHDSCVQAFRQCHVCGRRGRHEEALHDSSAPEKSGGCCCVVS